jgi:DNA primase
LQADLHAATQALAQLISTIAKAPRLRGDTQVEDRLREERFLQRLAADFRVSEDQVRQVMTEKRRKASARVSSPSAEEGASERAKIDPLERELLEILVQFPSTFERASAVVQLAHFASDACRAVFSQCAQLWSEGISPDFDRLLLEIEDPVVKNLLVELDEEGRRKATTDFELRLRDVLTGFEHRQRERTMRGRTSALRDHQLKEEDELAVLLELERQARARQQEIQERSRLGISDPTEG